MMHRSWNERLVVGLCLMMSSLSGCAMEVVEDEPDVGQASESLEQWIRDEAYVLSENAGASHAPTGSETYNSHGGENFVQRLGTGRYAVHAQFINEAFGNVQVVAYGRDPIRCKTSGWSTGSSRYLNSLLVNVLCHNERGLPADSQFAMYFLGKPLPNNAITSRTLGPIARSRTC